MVEIILIYTFFYKFVKVGCQNNLYVYMQREKNIWGLKFERNIYKEHFSSK